MKIKEVKILEILLGLSPFLILISPVESFTIISLFPLIIISLFFFLRNHRHIKIDYTNVIFFLLMGLFLISTIFNLFRYLSIATYYSFTSLIYMFGIFLWFCLNTNTALSQNSIRNQIMAYNMVSIIISVQMVYSSVIGTPGKIMFLNFLGIFMDENYITAILSISAVYSFVALLFDRNAKLITTFNIICLLFTTTAVSIGGSRASFLALIAGIFITFIYYIMRDFSLKKFIAIIVIMLILLFAFLIIKNIMPIWIYNRYFNLSGYNDNSNNFRLIIWKTAINGILDHPILGFGMGTYSEFDEHFFIFNLIDRGAPAHQTFLDFGIYGGFTGIFLFIAFLLSILFPLMRQRETRKYLGVIFVLLFISMIISATKSVFLWNNLIYLKLILMNSQNKVVTRIRNGDCNVYKNNKEINS